jgi:hypothetical protein
MEQFTRDEAKRWIGRTVIAKTDWPYRRDRVISPHLLYLLVPQ